MSNQPDMPPLHIQDILRMHQLNGAAYRGGYAYTQCSCGKRYKTTGWQKAYESYRDEHLTQILSEYMLGYLAKAFIGGRESALAEQEQNK